MFDARQSQRNNESADVPVIHHFFVKRAWRRQGRGSGMLKWWIRKHAPRMYLYKINSPNQSMRELLSTVNVRSSAIRLASSQVSNNVAEEKRLCASWCHKS